MAMRCGDRILFESARTAARVVGGWGAARHPPFLPVFFFSPFVARIERRRLSTAISERPARASDGTGPEWTCVAGETT
jgi:hypothetical protein